MTQEELNEYNRLTPRQKQFYDLGKEENPEWSHAQAILYALVCDSIQVPSDVGTANSDRIMVATIHNVQELMKSKFPRIYIQVEEKLSQMLYEFENKQKTEIK